MRQPLKRKAKATAKRRLQPAKLVIRHILVPLDFSGLSRQALTSAVPLARKHRAKISLVHVVQPPTVSTWRGIPGGGHYLAMNMHRLATVAKAHLEELATRLLPVDVRGRTLVLEGNPAYEVIMAARVLKADLVVLSTTGRSGLKRVFLGSTAERIVCHAHCPVLTVRRQMDESAKRLLALRPVYLKQLPWRRILVPVDFSLTSLRALHVAVELARESGARLYLLKVVEPNPYPTGMEGAVLVLPDAAATKLAKKQLSHVARRFVPKSVPVTTLIGRGRAASVIVETAEEKRVELIVLCTHGHTGLNRLLMGSTGEQVVRTAKCPVFVVRKPRDL